MLRHRLFAVMSACIFLLAGAPAVAQYDNSPSLGDLARQQRRQHAKDAQSKDGKTPKVFTNADLPGHSADADHSEDATDEKADSGKAPLPVASSGTKEGSEQLRLQIQEQKSQIAELQQQIDHLNSSIHFAPSNCVRGCEQWNERQQQKQQQVEQMQAQLAEQKKQLEEMQESARKQGFGSAVYDP
jgi:chromosome segregation ATPase